MNRYEKIYELFLLEGHQRLWRRYQSIRQQLIIILCKRSGSSVNSREKNERLAAR